MGRATTAAKKTVGYQPRLQKKRSLICLLWAWFTSRPSAGPWLSFSLCTPVHHCHIPAGSLVWVEIPSLNSHSVFAPGSLGEVEVCLQVEHLSTGNKTLPSIQSATQHYPSGVFTVTDFYLWCTNFNNCVTEDKKHRRKSGSRFSEARKRGHTMLYQLTSQFSRGGKREVNLGGVSTIFLSTDPQILLCTFLFTLQEKKRSYSDMQCPQSPVWIINADI